MKRLIGIAFGASLLFPLAPTVTFGQDFEDVLAFEEIVVTARKREENLREVPVSISVHDAGQIQAAGILNQFDLYESTPGISFDQAQDRQGARASVRGVQSNAQNPIRAKITSFVDGIPVLGQTGALQFTGIEQIEVMRGPQSAAFGRATFAGAINYVTKDPGDEFESQVHLATSGLDRNVLALSFSGPITETLGFTLDASFDEFRGPDEWVSSEGLRLGGESTEYITGKLVWAPSDRFGMELRLMSLDTDDDAPNLYFISEAALSACTNTTLPNGQGYVTGEWNCDSSAPVGGLPRNLRPEETLTPGTPNYFLAQSYGVLEPGSFLNRDRFQGEFNFALENDSLVQFLVSYSEDELIRWYDGDLSDVVPTFQMGMIGGVNSMANPSNIEETYAEIRWVSPADQSVRWVVGASVFDYTSLANLYAQLAGVILGLEDEANRGNPFTPLSVISDDSTNVGVYGNVTWDVSDRTTLSAEIRFQEDDVTNVSNITGQSFNNTTRSVQPRLAINHTINDNLSVYGQLASGTNPAGVSIDFLREEITQSLAAARAAGFITFDENSFLQYEEEELTNLEVGVKGDLLDNRLRLAAAIYVMEWDKMIQPTGFDWNDRSWNNTRNLPGGTFSMGDTMAMGYLNVGDGDLSGVEVEARYLPNENWDFRGALAIAKSEFASACLEQAVNVFGFTPTFTTAEGAPYDCVDVSGNDLPQQPDTTLTLSGTYTSPLGGSDWEWSGRLSLRYSDKEFHDTLNLVNLPATTIVNGSLTFRNDNWNLTLFGNNLTDEDTPRDINFNNDNNLTPIRRGWVVIPRLPREVGARLIYQF